MSFDLDSEFKRIHEEVYTEKTKPIKKEEVDKATLIERYNASFHFKDRQEQHSVLDVKGNKNASGWENLSKEVLRSGRKVTFKIVEA
jgi:hypothetical protein